MLDWLLHVFDSPTLYWGAMGLCVLWIALRRQQDVQSWGFVVLFRLAAVVFSLATDLLFGLPLAELEDALVFKRHPPHGFSYSPLDLAFGYSLVLGGFVIRGRAMFAR